MLRDAKKHCLHFFFTFTVLSPQQDSRFLTFFLFIWGNATLEFASLVFPRKKVTRLANFPRYPARFLSGSRATQTFLGEEG
jgi:hypothetical protein